MKGIWTIAAKDVRSLFVSPLFYLVAGICTLLWSIFFSLSLQEFAQSSQMMASQMGGEGASVHYMVFARHISLVNFVMILAVAAFTMRLFAEEKRQRTFDLLLTSPITATQITLGKFLGGVLVSWALVAISAIYPFATALIVKSELLPIVSAYIGLMLVVACYVGIGIFASSLTESSFLAVIMALLGNILLWFMGSFLESGEGPLWQAIHAQLALGNHFVNFLRGGVQLASLAYFITVVGLLVFITQRVVESNRWR